MRVELFFHNAAEGRGILNICKREGVQKVNIPNKVSGEDVLAYITQLELTNSNEFEVIPHYSLLNQDQSLPKGSSQYQSYLKFEEYVRQCSSLGVKEVLLITGSKARVKKKSVDTLQCLRIAAGLDGTLTSGSTKNRFRSLNVGVGVAYNPYFPDETAQAEEDKRLADKLSTGLVTSVWLQFGSDVIALERSLKRFKEKYQNSMETSNSDKSNSEEAKLGGGAKLIGSIMVPSKQLLARMKFRPWNGVFLSDEFLSSTDVALSIVHKLVQIYKQYGVEPLIETAIRTQEDMVQAKELVRYAESPESIEHEIVSLSEKCTDDQEGINGNSITGSITEGSDGIKRQKLG